MTSPCRPARTARSLATALLAAAAVLVAVPAAAVAAAPPTVTAFFAQEAAAPGNKVQLGFGVSNSDVATTLTGVSFSVTLPAGLVIANPSQLETTCSATATAMPGGSMITVSGITLGPAGVEEGGSESCSVLLDVVAPATRGVVSVTATAATSAQTGPGSPSNTTTLQVLGSPTILQSFGKPSIRAGETTTVTFTLANPNTATRLYNIEFADALPAGLVVAPVPNVSGTCLVDGSVTADPGATSIALLGQGLEAASQCSFSVDVQGTGATAAPNLTGPLTYNFDAGDGNFKGAVAPGASATLVVVGPPALATAFGAAAIGLNATTTLGFTLSNPNPQSALSGVGFSDALPAGLLVATPNGLSGLCAGATITAAAGSGSIALTGATLPALGSCTFGVAVIGVGTGQKTATTSAVSSVEGGPGVAASASLLVTSPQVAPPPPPPPAVSTPSNRFTVKRLRAARDGTVRFDITVAARGTVNVAATAGAAGRRYAFASKKLTVTKAGRFAVKIGASARGRRALRRTKAALLVSLKISFRPQGATTRSVRRSVRVPQRRRSL